MLKKTSLALAVVGVLALGCGGDGGGPTGPTAGTLTLSLATPNADDGAIIIRVTGPGIAQFAAADASDYLYLNQTAQSVTAVLVGEIDSGPLVRFLVPDVGAASSYAGTVLQVADRANELRGSLAGYGLTRQ